MKTLYIFVTMLCLFCFSIQADSTWVSFDGYQEGSKVQLDLIHSDEDSTIIEYRIPGFYWTEDSLDSDTLFKIIYFSLRSHAPRADR